MTLSAYYLGDFAGNYYINGIALAIVSVLNFVSSYKTSNMRTRIATVPTGIVGEYEALAPYVVNLVYNAIFGGLIGIVGSIYGFVIRSYVMKNKFYFVKIEENYRKNPHANFGVAQTAEESIRHLKKFVYAVSRKMTQEIHSEF